MDLSHRYVGIVDGENRASVLPEVPTTAEAGFPTVDVSVGFFILAPAGTPKPIIAVLNGQIVKALGTQDVKDRLSGQGVALKSSTPEELDALLKSEVARWGKIAKEFRHPRRLEFAVVPAWREVPSTH